MNDLDNALTYHALGWSLIPIRPGTKKSVGAWKCFQSEGATEAIIRKWWGGVKGERGIAVILGDVSGGLICRDFDKMDAYDAWAARFPKLAAELPTVETGRPGRHVYCRGDVSQIRQVRGGTILDLGDGELRGGGYCLLPESTHPNGHVYRWLNSVRGEVPHLNLFDAGFLKSGDATERTETHGEDGGQRKTTENTEAINAALCGDTPHPPPNGSVLSVLSVPLCGTDDADQIERAILESLPKRLGKRNTQVFDFCRALKAIPSVADARPSELKPHVRRWHELAKPVIGTQPFEDTWFEFLRGWPRVKFPKGSEPMAGILAAALAADLPEVALQYETDKCRLLVALCRELQRAAGDGPFYLSTRAAGRLLGVEFNQAWRWLVVLQADKIISLVSRGSQSSHKASRFRYLKEI